MLFRNREDAGRKLAEALEKFAGRPDVVVVALPRGGVVLGRMVADALAAPLDIVVTRKIGAEGNEEYAIGALTEAGHAVWNVMERDNANPAYLERVIGRERAEAQRRLALYRGRLPPRDLKGKTVIVVDDGIATGYTLRAALATVKSEHPARVVVAVPVATPDAAAGLGREADEVIVLSRPELFFAIGAFYADFSQVDDDTVIDLLRSRWVGTPTSPKKP